MVLVHFGQYSSYPAAYDDDEISFDYETGSWLVFHPELVVRQFDGEWASAWLD